MSNLSLKDGLELVASGVLTQKAFDKMQEVGKISNARTGRSSSPRRVFEGTEVSPQLYFKGAKDTEPTEAMIACRAEIAVIIENHTVLAG